MQPVPPTGATYQISTFGFHPAWSRDGKQIIYIPGFGRLGAIDVVTQPTFKYGPPELIPRRFNEKLGPTIGKNFDVTPDGQFVGLATPGETESASTSQINVVLNWSEELKARVPTR